LAVRNPRHYRDEVFADCATTASRLVSVVLIIGASLTWLQFFGLDISQVVALGGCGGIALGFAAKEVLQNFVGGVLLQISKPFVEGDVIQMAGNDQLTGCIRKVGLAYSQIIRDDGELLLVPNAEMLKAPTINRSRHEFRTISGRFPVTCGRRPTGGWTAVRRDVENVLGSHPEVLDEEHAMMLRARQPQLHVFAPRCNFDGFGPTGATMSIVAHVRQKFQLPEFQRLRTEMLLEVSAILQARGVLCEARYNGVDTIKDSCGCRAAKFQIGFAHSARHAATIGELGNDAALARQWVSETNTRTQLQGEVPQGHM